MPDSLIRWEKTRRDALGSAIALVFGLSSGAIAYCGSLLEHASFNLLGARLFVLAVIAFLFSLLLSVMVTVTRLYDFRFTVRVIKLRESGDNSVELPRLRHIANHLGKWTWMLFCTQIFAFLIGAVMLMVSIGCLYHQKLFL